MVLINFTIAYNIMKRNELETTEYAEIFRTERHIGFL